MPPSDPFFPFPASFPENPRPMTRRLLAVLTILVAAAAPRPIRAQQVDPFSEGERTLVNYAFATQLGSGVYSVAGRTVQVYRIPLSYAVRDETEDPWGLVVTFPLTFGFYDFRTSDVLDEGIPDNLDTASLVPGVEFRLRAGPKWLLKPHADAGVVRESTNSADAYVFGAGLRAIADYPARSFVLSLGASLDYSLVNPSGPDDDDILYLEIALEARHTLGVAVKQHALDYGLYGAFFLFVDDLQFPLRRSENGSLDDQYELGVTFGTKERVRIWHVPVPRFGFGYRFGEGISAVRFVIGIPVFSLRH